MHDLKTLIELIPMKSDRSIFQMDGKSDRQSHM